MTSIKYPRRKSHEIVINLDEKRKRDDAHNAEKRKRKIGKCQTAAASSLAPNTHAFLIWLILALSLSLYFLRFRLGLGCITGLWGEAKTVEHTVCHICRIVLLTFGIHFFRCRCQCHCRCRIYFVIDVVIACFGCPAAPHHRRRRRRFFLLIIMFILSDGIPSAISLTVC